MSLSDLIGILGLLVTTAIAIAAGYGSVQLPREKPVPKQMLQRFMMIGIVWALVIAVIAGFLLVRPHASTTGVTLHPTPTLAPTETSVAQRGVTPSPQLPSTSATPTVTRTPTRSPALYPRSVPVGAPLQCTQSSQRCPSNAQINTTVYELIAPDSSDGAVILIITNTSPETYTLVTDPLATADEGNKTLSANVQFPVPAGAIVVESLSFPGMSSAPGQTCTLNIVLSRGGSWTVQYDQITVTF